MSVFFSRNDWLCCIIAFRSPFKDIFHWYVIVLGFWWTLIKLFFFVPGKKSPVIFISKWFASFIWPFYFVEWALVIFNYFSLSQRYFDLDLDTSFVSQDCNHSDPQAIFDLFPPGFWWRSSADRFLLFGIDRISDLRDKVPPPTFHGAILSSGFRPPF